MPADIQRKLTTILAADAAGYSSRMEADEVGTLDELRASRDVFTRFIERHHGRIANTAGDGLIAEFPSVVEAVQCAIEVQRELSDQTHGHKALRFRIGIHLGDVIVDGEDLLGEGVNLAARLQTMAEPGGVLISQQVYDQVHTKLTVGFDYLGEKRPKNYSEDVPVYRVSQGQSHGLFDFGRKATPKRPPGAAPQQRDNAPEDLRERVTRSAKQFGLVMAALLVIDVATGSPFWMHWPSLALCTILALRALPLYFAKGRGLFTARFCVIVLMLVLINLFSWSGDFWAIWPAGALAFILLYRRFSAARGSD